MENDQNPEIDQDTQIDTTFDDVDQDIDTTDYKALYEEKLAEEQRKLEARQKRERFIKPATPIIKNNPEQDGEIARRIKNLERVEEKRQFGSEFGLTAEETDYIFAFSKGKPSKDTLEHPFIKAGLDGIRAQKRLENNTPNPSSRTALSNGKDFKDIVKEGAKEDKQAAFEEVLRNKRK